LPKGHKRHEKAHQLFFFFSTIAVLFVFSDPENQPIKIFGILSVSWWIAGKILILTSAATFYRMLSMSYYQRLLALQLVKYLEECGESEKHWFMYYPCLYTFHIIDRGLYEIPPTSALISTIVLLIGFLLNPFLLYIVGKKTSFTIVWWISAIILGFLIIASLLLYIYIPNWFRREIIIKDTDILD
jgi:hypothetical protein